LWDALTGQKEALGMERIWIWLGVRDDFGNWLIHAD
jgi:hypothetical protein